ncbi:MAG: lipoate-protein ligase A [Candidatus Marinamargulisbacteria bacterium]|jgi:lipoate-protein ligase A
MGRHLLDYTFDTPEANIACDEALLNWCEIDQSTEILRLWESPTYFSVLGLSNKYEDELNVEACTKQKIPILRRCSGGGTVLQGPGCLNYALILKINASEKCNSICETNDYILENMARSLSKLGQKIERRGISDLALGDVKISGTAQKRKRHYLLFHGTLLYNFDLEKISQFLAFPTLQPDYRQNRKHADFVQNLAAPLPLLKDTLSQIWEAKESLDIAPFLGDIHAISITKYADPKWNKKR